MVAGKGRARNLRAHRWAMVKQKIPEVVAEAPASYLDRQVE